MVPMFVWFAIPLGTLLLIPGFEAIRKEWKESATLMGATGFQFWIKIGIYQSGAHTAGNYQHGVRGFHYNLYNGIYDHGFQCNDAAY